MTADEGAKALQLKPGDNERHIFARGGTGWIEGAKGEVESGG
jgi:hypothetical protein